jgi:hypothetical protein
VKQQWIIKTETVRPGYVCSVGLFTTEADAMACFSVERAAQRQFATEPRIVQLFDHRGRLYYRDVVGA